jgi:hypothetical protein
MENESVAGVEELERGRCWGKLSPYMYHKIFQILCNKLLFEMRKGSSEKKKY